VGHIIPPSWPSQAVAWTNLDGTFYAIRSRRIFIHSTLSS